MCRGCSAGAIRTVWNNIREKNGRSWTQKDEEETKIEKLQRDVITEETIFKDEDEREAPVIKYEPETIKELRDKELEPAFMKKDEEEKIEQEKDKKEERQKHIH